MLDDDTAFLLCIPPLLASTLGAGAVALGYFLTSSALAGAAFFVVGVVIGWRVGRKILEGT